MRPDEEQAERLLRVLDHPTPAITAEHIAARARRTDGRRGRWAAVIMALAIGGVAYAAPRSPVRSWLDAARSRTTEGSDARRTSTTETVPDSGVAGVGVTAGEKMTISFGRPRDGGVAVGTAIITLTDDSEVVVRARREAATFTTDVDRLDIERWDPSATFEIFVPRRVPHVEIRFRDQLVFLKRGGTQFGSVDREPGPGPYLIRLPVR